eukprot:631276-Pleurochrysis_carterae.AAC.3
MSTRSDHAVCNRRVTTAAIAAAFLSNIDVLLGFRYSSSCTLRARGKPLCLPCDSTGRDCSASFDGKGMHAAAMVGAVRL